MKERIMEFVRYKGIPVSFFEQMCGLSNAYVKNISKGIGADKLEKILKAFPDLNREWLLTGEGEMLKHEVPAITTDATPNTPIARKANEGGIPLIPLDAIAGIANGNDTTILEYECERYVIPMFREADFLIPVKGSSMTPKYNSGDLVACKRLSLSDIFFQWNNVYVLSTDQGALIKRIRPTDDDVHILCVSDNKEYEPFVLHRSQIHSISLVVGVIRLE